MRGRGGPLALGCGLALLAASCGGVLDARRAVLCRRAVPALSPADTRVAVLRVGPGAVGDSVRVDYRLAGADGSPLRGEGGRPRFLVCGFGPGAALTTVTTERGPVNGAALYLLKRYYLETPEAEDADPGAR